MIFMLANYKGPNLGTLWIQLYINIKQFYTFAVFFHFFYQSLKIGFLTSGLVARAKVTPRAIKATKSLIICLRHGMHWILKYMCGQNMTDWSLYVRDVCGRDLVERLVNLALLSMDCCCCQKELLSACSMASTKRQ